jgi:hypothetical protein
VSFLPAKSVADDILIVESINLYLFMSIFILAFLTRIAGIPLEGFTEGLLASISMPVMYVIAYYKNRDVYRFVKPKSALAPILVARSWVKEFATLVSGFVVGFLIFMAITSSFNIMAYFIAYVCVHAMRLLLTLILPILARRVDIGNPAVLMTTSLVVSLITLTMLFLLLIALAPIFSHIS